MQVVYLCIHHQKVPMPSIPTSLSALLNPTEFAQLYRLRATLRQHFTRLYPTRLKELCPPAYGALFDTTALELPGLTGAAGVKGLIVFQPNDCTDLVASMVKTRPEILVHADLGLTRQQAYFSWSVPAGGGELPRTLWTRAAEVQKALDANFYAMGQRSMPLVFVAGNAAAVGEWAQDVSMHEKVQAALESAMHAPTGYTQAELQKAQQKATLYSECPWFLMRYELKSGHTRMAVNLAPIGKLNPVILAQ